MGIINGIFKHRVKAIVTYLESDSITYFIKQHLMFKLYTWLEDKGKQEEWLLKIYETSDPKLTYLVFAK
jgi:hypothetical protein